MITTTQPEINTTRPPTSTSRRTRQPHRPTPNQPLSRHVNVYSSSWLNLVERWFRDLTDKAIRRGVFHSVNDLIAAIEEYLKVNNDNPKPFIWTATTEQIIAKVARGRVALQQV